jgi:protein-S-isoprenylcysteine O-methyltransferase Ste14
MKKIDFYGVGPRIGKIALPWLAVTIVMTIVLPSIFKFPVSIKDYTMILGIISLVSGLILYGLTARALLKGLKEGRLVTTGTFRYCQNPLYALIMLLIIPAIAFMMNSWLVLTTTVVGYIMFRKCIGGEYKDMEQIFGEEYRNYRERTPEFFPYIKRI